MKRKYFLVPLVAGAVIMSACKDKSTTGTSSPDSSADTTTSQSAPTPDPIKPTATPDKRAAKLGFAKHLPKNIAKYDAVFNGKKAFREFLKTPMGIFAMERLADEGISLEDLTDNDEAAMQIAMYSEEYFTAYGDGTVETFDLVMNLLNRVAYYGGRTGVHFADAYVREGDDYRPNMPEELISGPLKGGPKELVKMFSEFNIPAFYQGSKVSDADMRDMVSGQMEEVTSLFSMAGDASEPITIERGDYKFTGYKLSGSKLSEQISDRDMEEMQEVFEAEDVNAFKEALMKKNIVCVSGTVGDYVVLFVGKSEDDLVLAESVPESLCANDGIVFLDSYLDKNIISVGFSDAKIVDTTANVEAIGFRMLSSLTKGLSDGLGNAGSLGDTQDIEALLGSITEQGEKLAGLFTAADAGYVAYIEDGLKAEGFGGGNMPAIDFSQKHSLAAMEGGDKTLLFANWTSDETYNESVMEYVDSLGETSYLLTKRIAALDIDDGEFRDFKQGVDMFDQAFRADAVELWKALRGDLAAGLGAESALVVDMNGALPKVPNVPDVILKSGKMPRISYVSTVNDRSKLQSSWSRVNASAENILKTISQMAGDEIPMQVPMSSEKDGLKTWFVPIPFQNDDFVPSVSVSDELFFVSTSKTFSEGLAERFKAGEGSDRKGAWLHVDFKEFNGFAKEWLDLVEKNLEEIMPGESAQADFTENKPMIEGALKAFSTLDSLTLHTRQEGGRTRVSLHLKAE
ncbi:MAG: hypothetical protein AB8F34_02500 [Akkermansiaceae bacterium]